MAPHDCRRLLLAHRDAGPAHVPDRVTSAPVRTPGLADPVQPAHGQADPCVASEPARPRAVPALRTIV